MKQHDLDIPIIFVSWRGRNSLRPFVSHSSRKFYFSLCNIDHTTISTYCDNLFFRFTFFSFLLDTIIEKLIIEEKNTNQKTDDS